MPPDVPLAQVQCPVGEVHQHRPGILQQRRGCQAHAARPRAQVQNPGMAGVLLQAVHGQLGQHLRVHPGNQRGRGDEKRQTAEGPLPQKIGNGFPGQTPGLKGLRFLRDGVCGIQRNVSIEFLRSLFRRGAKDLPGLQLGGLDPR